MITIDEDAFICDLAETYHIYDYKSLPASRIATFSVGLRENSRIKLKMNKMACSLETLLMASIADRLSLLIWAKTEDGQKGIHKPKSITEQLMGYKSEEDTMCFDTPEAFEKERKKIMKGR